MWYVGKIVLSMLYWIHSLAEPVFRSEENMGLEMQFIYKC